MVGLKGQNSAAQGRARFSRGALGARTARILALKGRDRLAKGELCPFRAKGLDTSLPRAPREARSALG